LELEYSKIGNFPLPPDCHDAVKKIQGCCGQCAIAAVLGTSVMYVFNSWEKIITEFRHYTSQKEMKEILACMGYEAIQHSPGADKFKIPIVDLAILRVSFGDPKQHWMITAQNSHYLGLKRMSDGNLYVFDNIEMFDHEPTNGLWIEYREYYKLMESDKAFITSYLEIIKQ